MVHGRVSLLVVALLTTIDVAGADEIKVAVASNFLAARAVASRFEETTGHQVTLIFGSTGKHYAQILNGAPFDLFLAADAQHPARLEREGHAIAASRMTYAVGTLVLWSSDQSLVDPRGEVLEQGDFRHLAIANPALAPYGMAAQQVLEARKLWRALEGRLVRGENIAQAFQFVASGNAELGFVALSQVERHGKPPVGGSLWKVPPHLHAPIEQQAVLLVDSATARDFLEFIRGDVARAIIREHGYTTPD